MGIITVHGRAMGSTQVTLTAGTVSKTIPVTVKSANLLSYGPAEGNGLTVTVNTDGSLHVKGTPSARWGGVQWEFPTPVPAGTNIRTKAFKSDPNLAASINFLDANGGLLGKDNFGQDMTVPEETKTWRLKIYCQVYPPQAVDADFQIDARADSAPDAWMRPDDTTLQGGVALS